MLRSYRSGERAPRGSYWNPYTGQFVDLEAEAGLPEGRGAFFRVSPPLLLVLGPFLGLFFLVFVPLAVPLVLGAWVVQRLRSAISSRPPARPVGPARPVRAN